MNVNDLKIDIIATVSQLSDIDLLEKIRSAVIRESKKVQEDTSLSWDIPEAEIRENVSFKDLMSEQRYQKVSFEDFVIPASDNDWKVSLDELLENVI